MDITIRPVKEDEALAFRAALIETFGGDAKEEDAERFLALFELDRTIAAFDGEYIVGTAGAFSFDLTVPGGTVPMGGTTIVSVRPTHRRRGILTMMMRAHLDEVGERREPLAGLWASEAPIYGRFGYGCASDHYEVNIDARTVTFRGDPPPGSVRFAATDEAAKVVPAIYERVRPTTPGMLSRSDRMWTHRRFVDPEHWREGSSARRWVIYEEDGRPDGYVAFRQKENWESWESPNGKVSVVELIAATPNAHAGLWRFLTSVDLFPNVHYWNASTGDRLPWLLDNRRAVKRQLQDDLWLRIMDVPEALTGRSYPSEGRLVLRVTDQFCDWVGGTFELVVDSDGVRCARSDDPPDLDMDVAELGAIYLGRRLPSVLAASGRLTASQEALAMADAMFRSDTPSWCPEVF